jgi:hypothetical protein
VHGLLFNTYMKRNQEVPSEKDNCIHDASVSISNNEKNKLLLVPLANQLTGHLFDNNIRLKISLSLRISILEGVHGQTTD